MPWRWCRLQPQPPPPRSAQCGSGWRPWHQRGAPRDSPLPLPHPGSACSAAARLSRRAVRGLCHSPTPGRLHPEQSTPLLPSFLPSRRRCRWDPEARFKIRVVCARPYHALFMHNMLIMWASAWPGANGPTGLPEGYCPRGTARGILPEGYCTRGTARGVLHEGGSATFASVTVTWHGVPLGRLWSGCSVKCGFCSRAARQSRGRLEQKTKTLNSTLN